MQICTLCFCVSAAYFEDSVHHAWGICVFVFVYLFLCICIFTCVCVFLLYFSQIMCTALQGCGLIHQIWIVWSTNICICLSFCVCICFCSISVVFLSDSVHCTAGLWVDSSNWNCLICKRLTRKCAANRWIRRSKIPFNFFTSSHWNFLIYKYLYFLCICICLFVFVFVFGDTKMCG